MNDGAMSDGALVRAEPPGPLYRLVDALLVAPVFHGLLQGRFSGREHVPAGGPLVVVANHGSHLDPPLLAHALMPRPLSFMAKQELFRVPLLAPLIRALGAYPVQRGRGDRDALETALDLLRQGGATAVFLDGTRQTSGRVERPQLGAALLAAGSGAQLLPVALVNTHRVLGAHQRRPRLLPVEVRIALPLPPPPSGRRADLLACTRACQAAINGLLDGAVPPADPDR